jgi:hypothetical protein
MKLSVSFSLVFGLTLLDSTNGQPPTVTAVTDTIGAMAPLLLNPAATGMVIVSTTATAGRSEQFGKYTKPDAVFPGLNKMGIVMSSGDVTTVSAGNDDRGFDFNGDEDAGLEALLEGDYETKDTAALVIAVNVPTAVYVTFSYVFASNEYSTNAAEFPDLFGFYVDGVNQAKINGAAVSTATVNCGDSGHGVGPNCGQFVKNDDDQEFGTDIDGYTKTQTMTVLFPAGPHTIRIAIADADAEVNQQNDGFNDAFVFLSFKSAVVVVPPPVAPPKGMMGMGMGMMGMRY